jgi:alcohol dehydrogenase class IV
MEARKHVSPEFVFGEGALALVGRYASNFNANKVLLVTDPGVIAAGWAAKAEDSLSQMDIPIHIYSGVSPNPRDTEIMQGAGIYLAEQCNIIVAVGGGSPIDCAKGIGIVVSNNRHILEFEGVDKIPIPGPPLICIPTTSGSAADVSQFDIVNDTVRKVKIVVMSKATIPDVALIDPLVATTMSAALTAATGIDALVHAIEAYVSLARSPITDLHALEAIRLVSANLIAAIEAPDNLLYREQMMLGSLLAGLAFSNASLGLVHAMAHALGGWMDLPHGACNAMLLEHVVSYNFDSAPDRYRCIGKAFGMHLEGLSPEESKKRMVANFKTFRRSTGLTHSLKDYCVDKETIRELARSAYNDPCLVTNPIQPTVEDIERIYERALDA